MSTANNFSLHSLYEDLGVGVQLSHVTNAGYFETAA